MVLFMDNRLSSSSQSTIATAVGKHWVPFCQLYDLSLQVASGSPNRGGIMASFIIYLANKQLAYPTITSYLWGVVDHHLALGFASPLSTVRDWSTFMHSVEVETHTPADGLAARAQRAQNDVLIKCGVGCARRHVVMETPEAPSGPIRRIQCLMSPGQCLRLMAVRTT